MLKRFMIAAALCAASPAAHAQSALEWAATGMGSIVQPLRPAARGRNRSVPVDTQFAARVLRSESRLSGVYSPLAAKAQEIASSCGSRVVSGVRHTRVAGSRRWSLHASGHAVDMAGNPACIYAHLRGWPGGYSTDYGRVRHVHISLGGREDGVRFAHRGGRTRIAWR